MYSVHYVHVHVYMYLYTYMHMCMWCYSEDSPPECGYKVYMFNMYTTCTCKCVCIHVQHVNNMYMYMTKILTRGSGVRPKREGLQLAIPGLIL